MIAVKKGSDMLNKKSYRWVAIAAIVFAMVFFSLYFVYRLHTAISPQFENISGFIAMATLVSAVVCGGGYLGKKRYFAITFACNLFGLILMLFTAIQTPQESQHALGSVFSYVLVFVLGVMFAVVIELLVAKSKQ